MQREVQWQTNIFMTWIGKKKFLTRVCLIYSLRIHNHSCVVNKFLINAWSDIQNRFLYREMELIMTVTLDSRITSGVLTCCCGDCFRGLGRWERSLDTWGGHLDIVSDSFNMFWDLFPVMFLQLPVLIPLLPLLPPSLYLGVIVGICSTTLTIKVVHKNLLLLFNDLNIIILVFNTVRRFPGRVRWWRKFGWRWRGRVRSWKVQT